MFSFKQISLTILSLVMLMKAIIVPVICLDYELRKEFIVQNYCINKNLPELHCDGKCYLAKKIKAAQQQEEQQGSQDFIKKIIAIANCQFRQVFVFFASMRGVSIHFSYLQQKPNSFCASLFQPPCWA